LLFFVFSNWTVNPYPESFRGLVRAQEEAQKKGVSQKTPFSFLLLKVVQNI
jgi:hypothetical protein